MCPILNAKRDLRRSADLSTEDIEQIFDLSVKFKKALRRGEPTPVLTGKSLAMIFEKQSLRTRSTFELAMVQLGGHAVNLSPQEIGLGQRETVRDVAMNIERWFDLAMARTYLQSTIEELADHCHIPFINALSDEEHPCQALADFLTIQEKFGSIAKRRITYVGDGNNICHSLMVTAAKLGASLTVCSPEEYRPSKAYAESIQADLRRTGGSFTFCTDPAEAVRSAEAIYTDVWTSMGQEAESEKRLEAFGGYQINAELLAGAPSDALIMHDLPAHRGEEITDEILDGPNCIAFDQAENRLHAQKGLLAFLDRESR